MKKKLGGGKINGNDVMIERNSNFFRGSLIPSNHHNHGLTSRTPSKRETTDHTRPFFILSLLGTPSHITAEASATQLNFTAKRSVLSHAGKTGICKTPP